MATSEPQKQAVKKYRKKNRDRIHRVMVEIFDSKDPDIWPWLDSQEESNPAIIRRLIREEIERTGWKSSDSEEGGGDGRE